MRLLVGISSKHNYYPDRPDGDTHVHSSYTRNRPINISKPTKVKVVLLHVSGNKYSIELSIVLHDFGNMNNVW